MKRLSFVLWLALQALSSTVAAQPADEQAAPSPGDQAIQKGQEALALFERGKWADAARTFEEADRLFHSPVFILYQARSERNLGHLREAKRVFSVLSSELLGPSAPSQWRDAQLEGAKELGDLELTAPRLLLEVEGGAAGVRATVDGVPVDIGVASLQDPGEHRIRVTRGAVELDRTITLHLSRPVVREVFRFFPDAVASKIDPWLVVGATLTSLGGASLIVGATMGGLALQKSAEAKLDLPLTCSADLHCREGDEAVVDAHFRTTYQFASAADGLLVSGALLAVAGIVILIVDPGRHVAPTGRSLVWRF